MQPNRKSQSLQPAYLVYGENFLRSEEIIRSIKKLFYDTGGEEVSVFHSEDISIERIIDEVSTVSLFGSQRLIIVRGSEKFGTASLKKIISYLKNPFASNCIVFVFLKLSPVVSGSLKSISKESIKHCPRLKAWDIVPWIKKVVESNGRKISSNAAAVFSEMTGEEPELLKTEIEKLLVYTCDSKEISEQDVLEIISLEGGKFWDLVNNIVMGAEDRAIGIFRKMNMDISTITRLLYVLHKQLVEAALVKWMVRGKMSDIKIAQRLGLAPGAWKLKKIKESAAKFKIESLLDKIQAFASAMVKIRLSPDNASQALMERFILELCAREKVENSNLKRTRI